MTCAPRFLRLLLLGLGVVVPAVLAGGCSSEEEPVPTSASRPGEATPSAERTLSADLIEVNSVTRTAPIELDITAPAGASFTLREASGNEAGCISTPLDQVPAELAGVTPEQVRYDVSCAGSTSVGATLKVSLVQGDYTYGFEKPLVPGA